MKRKVPLSKKARICHECGKSVKESIRKTVNAPKQRGQFFGPLRWFPFDKK